MEAVDRSNTRITYTGNDPARERGTLNMQKAGGAVDLPEAPYGARIVPGGRRIRVGTAGGVVDANT